MGTELDDTICAVATPVGEGGIGIVRISGGKAIDVAAAVVRLRHGRSLHDARSRRMYLGDLVPGGEWRGLTRGEQGDVLDQALVVVMRRPQSYTGETVVEIQAHGGPLVLQLLCGALVRAGARPAEPGEFTKRAFLNGRLDLAQAEAVLDTIRARTESGLGIAQEQLRGVLSARIDELRVRLIRLLGHVEAAIDFTEEDLTFVSHGELEEGLRGAVQELARLTDSAREGRIFREGLAAVIAGRANVGKSSLLNALLETDRAIVTEVPGTTRDVLEEALNIRGIPVRLIDTAGLRATRDEVEREGVRRSRAAMEQAELLMIVLDGSNPLTDEDRELVGRHEGKKRLLIVNKIDLPRRLGEEEVAGLVSGRPDCAVASISAKSGAGLDGLRDRLRELVVRRDFEPGESPTVTRLRHLTALTRAKESLTHTRESVAAGLSAEFVSVDLRAAIDALGAITGAVTTDEILDQIFREFCIGK